MRFWDASAILPLLVGEAKSSSMLDAYRRDPVMFVWWGTEIECVSALARLEREGLPSTAIAVAAHRLAALRAAWQEIQPGSGIRQGAIRLLRTHALRAADALQLSAAIIAAEGQPAVLSFVTLDDRLAAAAAREGFPVA